jgi:hypothetical protein
MDPMAGACGTKYEATNPTVVLALEVAERNLARVACAAICVKLPFFAADSQLRRAEH